MTGVVTNRQTHVYTQIDMRIDRQTHTDRQSVIHTDRPTVQTELGVTVV